ncbi:MAG: hypothetical protein R3244_07970 [Thermoanaerobaculia bacterium]|nr:hypothetical protein [Thermoanaerobaculia bacterium]
MLKPPDRHDCEAFRRRYERGMDDPHLSSCEDCRRFAEFVDSLARVGYRAPLEETLRARLRGVPAAVAHGVRPFPRLPDLPISAGLEQRLRAIGRPATSSARRASLPIWIRSPRYAVAASYLLTLLVAGTIGNPAAWASETANRFERVGVVLHSVEAGGRERVDSLRERVSEGYAVGREWIRASGETLLGRWQELVEASEESETNPEVEPVQDRVDLDSNP